MSNNDDREGADWYPGMELPSRKQTHGRKKKSDRKVRQEEQQEALSKVDTSASPPAVEAAEAQWQAYRDEVAVTAAIAMPMLEDVADESDVVPGEEDDGPVIARWKVALFFLFAPILLIAVLAYGKLAYVHQVPDFVRQHVPAYQSGEGFLILKPWWFGPPVFDLNSYPLSAGEEYSQWQLQLSDYTGVVQNPTVLYTFQQDIMHTK